MTDKRETQDKFTKLIAAARTGDSSAAWMLVEEILAALEENRVSPALFGHAAGFFAELLDLREKGKESRGELAKALSKLHIVRGRGNPKRESEQKMELAAKVQLVMRADYSADEAINALDSLCLMGVKKGAYHDAWYGPPGDPYGKTFERFLELVDVEAIAGISQLELVEMLLAQGALAPKKK